MTEAIWPVEPDILSGTLQKRFSDPVIDKGTGVQAGLVSAARSVASLVSPGLAAMPHWSLPVRQMGWEGAGITGSVQGVILWS